MMNERFVRNIPAISEEEQALLQMKRVFVAGCGGLGGYVVEYLARLGVARITVLDSDAFEESNMNRQLLVDSASLGKGKAETAKRRILSINPAAEVEAIAARLTEENAASLIGGHDLVIDALDSVEARLTLEDACAQQGIAIIHGAVSGWSFQVAVVLPGSGLLRQLYGAGRKPDSKTILSFVPPCCAAVQVAEAALYLCGRPSGLDGRAMFFDMETMESLFLG